MGASARYAGDIDNDYGDSTTTRIGWQQLASLGNCELSTTAVPTMTVDDACKLLSVAAGATWESIEQSRRLLVKQSHPERVASMTSIKRDQARDAARRVNDAYAVLSRLRTGGNSKLAEV